MATQAAELAAELGHELVRRADGDPNAAARPTTYKAVGLTLAICSGLFIGTSFVLKKVGLLRANVKYNEEAGEGYGYLKNAYWWTGMTLMIIGEICNFVAYALYVANGRTLLLLSSLNRAASMPSSSRPSGPSPSSSPPSSRPSSSRSACPSSARSAASSASSAPSSS